MIYVCVLQFFCLLSSALVLPPPAAAKTYVMPPVSVDLVGRTAVVPARAEDTLLDIARRHGLGQDEILLANPRVDRWLPGEGTGVLLPTQFIFPQARRDGVVLNLPEMRLYYFYHTGSPTQAMVNSYPISIGRLDWRTPLGRARVEIKDRDPYWRPPESLREEARADGEYLPEIVPPGPENPLGRYALRLSIPGYLIHSTNKPYGVGMRVTHGCVRMYPEDIAELFPLVPKHTAVEIVNQPVKAGWRGDVLYLEVHPPLAEETQQRENLSDIAYTTVFNAIKGRRVSFDFPSIRKALQEQNGIPVPIGTAVQGTIGSDYGEKQKESKKLSQG